MKLTENLPFTPGVSQRLALELLEEFLNSDRKYFILKGYAGTGKTTLLKVLINAFRENGALYVLCAPTGRAAKVISEKTGMRASTMHRMIYSYASLMSYSDESGDDLSGYKFYFALRKNTELTDAVIIVDEASMISGSYNDNGYIRFGSGKLLNDLIKYVDPYANNNKIIFIGDNAQLPPVRANVSAALSVNYLRDNFNITDITVTELKEVFRQDSESEILSNATRIRDSILHHDFSSFSLTQNTQEVVKLDEKKFIEEYFELIDSSTDRLSENIIITYSNKKAFLYNQLVREHIFPYAKRRKKGEIFDEPLREIMPGDMLIISKNCYLFKEFSDEDGNVTYIPIDLYNGEFVKVLEVEPIHHEDRKNVLVKSDTGSGYVNLNFRNIVIGFKDYYGNELTMKVKIIEDYLNSSEPAMSMEHYKALFVEFKERFIRENMGKLEQLRRRSKRFKEIEDTDLFKQAIKRDPYFNALMVKFGYAVTCHKAQGGEWKNVFVDFSGFQGINSELFFRWSYTALTRAKEKLFVMHAPDYFMDGIQETKRSYRVDSEMSLPVLNYGADIKLLLGFPPGKAFLKNLHNEISGKMENGNISIREIEHFDGRERYHFTDESGEVITDYKYDGEGNFIDREIIITEKYSKELAQKIMNLLFDSDNESITDLESRLQFPDNKAYKELFRFIYERITPENICIHMVEHKNKCERYYFKSDKLLAAVDFHFDNNDNLFSVQGNRTNSQEFIELIRGIINDGV